MRWWEVLELLRNRGRRMGMGVGGNSLSASFNLLSMRELSQQVGLSPEKVTL